MHVRCPHCHNRIELVDDAPLADIQCPSCGSSFNLVDRQQSTTIDYQGGKKIAHFELIEQLGIGAFGSVSRARDTQLDREVALKVPRKDQLEPAEMERFLREARAAAQLRHPHIVQVHEVGRDGDQLYIVSDLVRGATLADWLTGQRLTVREAAELCIILAEALHHAHTKGIVHRDVKPSNIMLEMRNAECGLRNDDVSAPLRIPHSELRTALSPLLLDFGLAKREAGEITMTLDGRALGTPAYMSPEQARGEGHDADARSDIYSLGVILFQLLTGELPFRGNARMLIVQIQSEEPPSPRKLNANIPRDLETITLKCLEKSPDRRYPTAQALADELRRYVQGKPIMARPVGQLEHVVRWCRRNPVVAALIATVAATLLIGTTVSLAFAWQAGQKAADERQARKAADDEKRKARESAERAEGQSYLANITAAGLQLEDGNIAEARRRLAACPKHLRGWEWDHFALKCDTSLMTLTLPEAVYSVRFSNDGKRLAAGLGRTVEVMDAINGQSVMSLDRHDNSTYSTASSIEFSSDGRHLASAGVDLRIWNTESWRLTASRPKVEVVSFGSTPTLMENLWGESIRLRNLETGEVVAVLRGHVPRMINIACFSHNSGHVVMFWFSRKWKCVGLR